MSHITTNDKLKFEYVVTSISDLQVNTTTNAAGKQAVNTIMVRDEPLVPTSRFWVSLYARYGFNQAFFKYFSYTEVFERIALVRANDRIRLCIERDGAGNGLLLGVSNPTRPIVDYNRLADLLADYNYDKMTYNAGVVESVHVPCIGDSTFELAGDRFNHRFLLAMPIDGYGMPSVYLSLLRLACNNDVIGYSGEFRSSLNLGKGGADIMPAIVRIMQHYNNDEGYAAIRQRLESATRSWCSVNEANELYKLLARLHHRRVLSLNRATPPLAVNIGALLSRSDSTASDGPAPTVNMSVGSPLIRAFHILTGDISCLYGLANPDSLSTKRQRTLPVRCTVYDIINFATEVATHYAEVSGARAIHNWVGSLLSNEYDMEGTKEKFGDFADFYFDSKLTSQFTGSGHVGADMAEE